MMAAQNWTSAFPLENEDVKLLPLNIERHGRSLQGIAANQEIWAHLAHGPYASPSDFYEHFPEDSPSTLVLVIIHKSSVVKQEEDEKQNIQDGGFQDGGPVAGMVSLATPDGRKRRASVEDLILLPDFRSQGLAFQASRLLVDAGFRPRAEGGLGLIEITWECSTENEAVRRVAIRLGLKEGRIREYYELVEGGVERGKIGNGKPVPKNTKDGEVWQDMVTYALTVHEWNQMNSKEEEEEAEMSDDSDEEEDEEFVMDEDDEDDDSEEDEEEEEENEEKDVKMEDSDGEERKPGDLQSVHQGVSHLRLK